MYFYYFLNFNFYYMFILLLLYYKSESLNDYFVIWQRYALMSTFVIAYLLRSAQYTCTKHQNTYLKGKIYICPKTNENEK